MNEEEFIIAHTPQVKRQAQKCARRFELLPEDVEDLISDTLLKMVSWYRRYPNLRDQPDVGGLLSVFIKHKQSEYGQNKISKHNWIRKLELNAPYEEGGEHYPDLPAPDTSSSKLMDVAKSVICRFEPEQQRMLDAHFGISSGTPQTSVEMGIIDERAKSAFFRLRRDFLRLCRTELGVPQHIRTYKRKGHKGGPRKQYTRRHNPVPCNIGVPEFRQLFLQKLTRPKTINEVYAEMLADGKQLSIHAARSRVKELEHEKLIKRVGVRTSYGHEIIFIANKE
jgi:hypothetical protein